MPGGPSPPPLSLGQGAPLPAPLVAAAGPDRVRPADPDRDAIDGMVPRLVVAPADEDALARVLNYCHRHRLAVVPRGGGTQLGLGAVPERADVVLDVGALAGIVHYEPADLTVTVQAGMRLADLQAELRRHGQFLPLDPPLAPETTIGGLLATGAGGPLRTGFGHLRDRLLGMRVARADGTIIRSGGRVVKNVAGYDLGRLHTGALGTLGVILEATFKVQPLPAAWGCVRIDLDPETGGAAEPAVTETRCHPANGLHPENIEALVDALLAAPAQPVLLELAGPPPRLWVAFAGTRAEVDFAVEQACRVAGSVLGAYGESARPVPWAEAHAEALAAHRGAPDPGRVRDSAGATSAAPFMTCRLHAPSSQVAALLERAAKDAAAAGLACTYAVHVVPGIVRLHLGPAPAAAYGRLLQAWLALCRGWGGNLVVERAPAEVKPSLPLWGEPPASLFLMRALKEKFDPHRILNPGRYVGGL